MSCKLVFKCAKYYNQTECDYWEDKEYRDAYDKECPHISKLHGLCESEAAQKAYLENILGLKK